MQTGQWPPVHHRAYLFCQGLDARAGYGKRRIAHEKHRWQAITGRQYADGICGFNHALDQNFQFVMWSIDG